MSDNQLDNNHFLTSYSGQIEYVIFEGGVYSEEEIVLRCDIQSGQEWKILSGYDGIVTHTATSSHDGSRFVFNMPINCTFKSTTPYGWPQLIVSVYGISPWGVEAIKGYGRCHFPSTVGRRSFEIPLFAPQPNSLWEECMSRITGKNPELIDPTILASGDDSYLLRTRSYGQVSLNLSLMTKGFRSLGYDNVSTCTTALVQE